MKVLTVYAHDSPQSFCHAVLDQFTAPYLRERVALESLEAVEGRDLAAVVAEHVTGPLRLASMGFDLSPGQRELLVSCYADGSPNPIRMPDEFPINGLYALRGALYAPP